jgi:ribosomal protein S25
VIRRNPATTSLDAESRPSTRSSSKDKSGNPKGRPKGSKSFATEIREELDAQVRITENGKFRKITKRRAVAKQLVNGSVAGNPKTMPTLLNHIRILEGGSESSSNDDVLSQPEDALVMENIIKRIREAKETLPENSVEPDAVSQASDAKNPGEGDPS